MKLHEIKSLRKSSNNASEIIWMEPAGGIYGEVKLNVTYHYTSASITRHGDNHTFDEHHAAEIEINDMTLDEDVQERDKDGDVKNGSKIWQKGEDATNLPGWTEKDDEHVLGVLHDKKADNNDSDDDYDDYDDRYP